MTPHQRLALLEEAAKAPLGPQSSNSARFSLVTADSVTMKSVKWILQGRIPLAMLTVLAGRGGLGKSTLAIDWAAQVTLGTAAGALAGSPSHVIISSAEDTESETLTPRLRAAQADMSKVHFIHLHREGTDGSLTIPDDIESLREAIQQTQTKFVIIDPLMSHLSATLNGWNDQEIRRALTPLAKLAEDLQVSILVVAHLNKNSKADAIDRIGGSVGIANTARSVLFAGPDPDDPEGRIKMLAHPKCNVGPEQPTLRYRTETVILQTGSDPIETTRIIWDGEAPGITAQDLVARQEPVSREDRGRAVAWLEKALPVGVHRKQIDLEAEATAAGFSRWTLKTAKSTLEVKSRKEGFNPATWVWWREAPLIISSPLVPSVEICPKPLINAKGSEGTPLSPFAASSPPEGTGISSFSPFAASSNISIGYRPLSPEGTREGDIERALEAIPFSDEEVDLDAD